MEQIFKTIRKALEGEIYWDETTRIAYSTDASIYREMPAAVAYPRDEADIVVLVEFARTNNFSLIPRTAGTSLAGQVVGPGIVVDVSRYMNRILQINTELQYAWVEPGVVPDELNKILAPSGLFFAPETSSANRCMIGGMLGNNACGLHSLVYGSTRDHTLAVRAVLSDGSIAEFSSLTTEVFKQKCRGDKLENQVYSKIRELLNDSSSREAIKAGFPDPSIPRRNNGYAIDLLADTDPFTNNGVPFNLAKLLGGSEGTLVFFSAIKINLTKLPPPHKALICVHFNSLGESLRGNLVALEHNPAAVEMMDSVILECTKANHTQNANRFFLEGDPRILLIIEMVAESQELLDEKISKTIEDLKNQGLGYAYPVVYGPDIKKVWDLRKAGLGLLSNIPGDSRPVAIIEDIAVPVGHLAGFIKDMEVLFDKSGTPCVYYAHVGTGELHLRPVLNLKDHDDITRLKAIISETVGIVKKYRGSLSGEHGDGRLRSNYLEELLGPVNYQMIREIKRVFDPKGIFNPGKITDPAPVDSCLRTTPGLPTPEIPTLQDFDEFMGIIRAAEKCNGSGDCRKSHLIGGTMCPSFQATRDEKNSTRARANVLREFLYRKPGRNYFDHPEIYQILDLCLSCKACKSECPSGVDIAKLKAEFLYQWYKVHRIPLRVKLIAWLPFLYQSAYRLRKPVNWLLKRQITAFTIKKLAGFAPQRSIPLFSDISLAHWWKQNGAGNGSTGTMGKGLVFLFIDEFTDYQDAEIGIKTVRLLTGLGYRVVLPNHQISARTFISKGLLGQARKVAIKNVELLRNIVTGDTPLVGIEPSAILSFRDEYPDLVGEGLRRDSLELARNVFMLEEFLAAEMRRGKIERSCFNGASRSIMLHGHCQQKAVASTADTLYVLNFPQNFTCTEIPSGCCGMAGAFGYEKEHFDLSMKVGELILFPEVRKAPANVVICAPGTSCRHHILDGTGRKAFHPAEILHEALMPAD